MGEGWTKTVMAKRLERACIAIRKGRVKEITAPPWKWLIHESIKTDLHVLTWKQGPEQVMKWKKLVIKQCTWWDAMFIKNNPHLFWYISISNLAILQSPTFRFIHFLLIPKVSARPISPPYRGAPISSFKKIPKAISGPFLLCSAPKHLAHQCDSSLWVRLKSLI